MTVQSRWGKIRKYDAQKAEAAAKLPATQEEVDVNFKDQLTSRIRYNLMRNARLADDGKVDAQDLQAIDRFCSAPQGPSPDEYALHAGKLVASAYRALRAGSNQSEFTYAALAGEALNRADQLWKQVDRHDPSTLSKEEVKVMIKKDADLGFYSAEATNQASFLRGDKAGTVYVDDPKVRSLHTPEDYLLYNWRDVINEEWGVTRKVSLSEVPEALRAPVEAARGAIQKRFKKIESEGVEDFRSTLEGPFEVYKKPGDPEIVGYVVRGTSDYDYDSGTDYTIALSMDGQKLVDDENQRP